MSALFLLVEVRSAYGRVTIYPACPVSEGFCALLKQKSLTETDIEKIKELGYIVRVKEVGGGEL